MLRKIIKQNKLNPMKVMKSTRLKNCYNSWLTLKDQTCNNEDFLPKCLKMIASLIPLLTILPEVKTKENSLSKSKKKRNSIIKSQTTNNWNNNPKFKISELLSST